MRKLISLRLASEPKIMRLLKYIEISFYGLFERVERLHNDNKLFWMTNKY